MNKLIKDYKNWENNFSTQFKLDKMERVLLRMFLITFSVVAVVNLFRG